MKQYDPFKRNKQDIYLTKKDIEIIKKSKLNKTSKTPTPLIPVKIDG